MKLTLLPHGRIDKSLWDQRLYSFPVFRMEAESGYLDSLGEWDAIVNEDYTAFMPLPYSKKFFIKRYLQPVWAQQLGIFSSHLKEITPLFFEYFRKKKIHFHYHFHHASVLDNRYITKVRPNYILSLCMPYESIYERFTENTRRNIKKGIKNGLSVNIHRHISPEMENRLKQIVNRSLTRVQLELLFRLLRFFEKSGYLYILEVENISKKSMSGLLIFSHNRFMLTYHGGYMNKELRSEGGFYVAFHHLIREFSGTSYSIDFEGSQIEGVARFFKGFGSINLPFYEVVR